VAATPWAASPLSSPYVPCSATVGFLPRVRAAEQLRKPPAAAGERMGDGTRLFTVCPVSWESRLPAARE
jgi:hypothetical protein